MPYNPAWVCHADDGVEIHLFSASGAIGTNAYSFSKNWLTNNTAGKETGPPVEDRDYSKDFQNGFKKYLRGNIDVLGPAVSLRVRPNLFAGVYTRIREVANGGNLSSDALRFIGDRQQMIIGREVQFDKAGFTIHVFGEAGLTLGTVLMDNGYHRWRGGVTVKYLSGFAAGSVYTGDAHMQMKQKDSLAYLAGNLSVKYAANINKLTDHDINNDGDVLQHPAGRNSLGMDIGVQYEYHPDYSPNHETPYLFSIAASVTDIGSIRYKAGEGSAVYKLKLKDAASTQYARYDYEPTDAYLNRLVKDSLLDKNKDTKAFNVGLPTAFRLNIDALPGDGFAVSANILLNLQSTKNYIYNPGYTGMLNITPRFERRRFMIALPFTFIRHQQMTAGAVVRVGPVFAGSASLISCLMASRLHTLDGYAGISLKLKNKEQHSW